MEDWKPAMISQLTEVLSKNESANIFDKGTERKFSSFLIKNVLVSAFLGFTLVDVNIWSITKEMGVNIYKALFNIW